ncbi:MAG: hypothetical protein FVQ83_07815 [Chloroflexi bacterium]|nr:hypothetical protein [Chloroflexota bacterium]
MSLKKIGALAGIAFPILQMTAQGLIQVGGMEPAFADGTDSILAFFQNRDPSLFTIGEYLSVLSLVVFLWFLGALWQEFNSEEGENRWLVAIVLGSGLVTTSAISGAGGWALAMFRINENLDPQIARMLFDQGNLNFANTWVSYGSMVLAAGLLFNQSKNFPKWLGWSSLALAIGLFTARFFWTSQIAFAPYVLFWVWMIVVGINLYRRE